MNTFSRTLASACLFLASLNAFAQDNAAGEQPEILQVSSKPLAEILFFPGYSAPADVVSLNDSLISAQLNAQILSIDKRVGDQVKQGERLVALDCDDATLGSSSAQTRLDLARREVNRLSKLKKASAVTEQNLNIAETDLKQATIAYKQAQLQVERCDINAPFDGVITERLASQGELASPGTPLLRMQDLSSVEIIAQIPGAATAALEQAADITFAWSGKHYSATIRSLSPVINPSNRNREVRLLFNGEAASIGAAGRLRWQSKTAHVPADMLLQRNDATGLFIVDGNKASFIPIAGAQAGHPAVVDLPGDTQVITDGRFGLNDGDTIENRGL
ncbi:MAG: efflux RND transporter periplasmic adaptor subunit [Gammaproteobacteria bacterium]|nr:efflux RND transporter periplasmic adaptor subunit [Gammaproteobacteria bacterium]